MCFGQWRELNAWNGVSVSSVQKFQGGFAQPFHRNAVMPEDVRLRAGDGVLVWNADDAKRFACAVLQQNRCACFPKAAVNHVFFYGDNCAAFTPSFKNS